MVLGPGIHDALDGHPEATAQDDTDLLLVIGNTIDIYVTTYCKFHDTMKLCISAHPHSH